MLITDLIQLYTDSEMTLHQLYIDSSLAVSGDFWL